MGTVCCKAKSKHSLDPRPKYSTSSVLGPLPLEIKIENPPLSLRNNIPLAPSALCLSEIDNADRDSTFLEIFIQMPQNEKENFVEKIKKRCKGFKNS